MDNPSGSGRSDLSLEDLMGEYASRPSVAQSIWFIEYLAKFKKDLHHIHAMMSLGLKCSADFGKRTNEVVALRILEFICDSNKQDGDAINLGLSSEPNIEFDLSLGSIDVLKAILKEIPLARLKPGMPELSKFNVLPFIAHKKSCLPGCALERLRDAVLDKNQANAAPSTEANEPATRDEQPMHTVKQSRQIGEEAMHWDRELGHLKDVVLKENERNAAPLMKAGEPSLRDGQSACIGEKSLCLDERANVITDDDHDDDEPMHHDEGDKTDESEGKPKQHGDVRVKCGKDGTWLICDRDKTKEASKNIPSSSQTRREGCKECVKCKKPETTESLLICSNRNCSAMVHRECLNGPASLDKNSNFYCPQCWYEDVTSEYLEAKTSMEAAKRKLVMFQNIMSAINRNNLCR